jgi:two-component system, chemotaxis family, protein-glutamate methylesterase/glutaminase
MSLKVLVADDSILFRRVLSDTLASLPDVVVVGTAANGRQAVQKVLELKPDLLTLDMEMPELDGIGVLDALRQAGSTTAVVVVSALTRKGGQLTMRALERGAFDFITKPDTTTADQSRDAIKRELAPLVRAIAQKAEIKSILRTPAPSATAGAPRPAAAPPPPRPISITTTLALPPTPSAPAGSIASRMERIASPGKPGFVLIGVSTGGPAALARIFAELPGTLGVPVFIVQHMPPLFTQSLAESLSAKSALSVREAVHGETAVANTAYIAPGGRHLRLAVAPDGGIQLQITDDPPEQNCRPAVDYLFRSASIAFPGRAMAVILTGMGSDGTLGLRLLRRHGCFTIAQDETTCVVYGMPRSAVEAGVVDAVVPLDGIARRLVAAVRGLTE